MEHSSQDSWDSSGLVDLLRRGSRREKAEGLLPTVCSFPQGVLGCVFMFSLKIGGHLCCLVNKGWTVPFNYFFFE